MLLVFAKEIEYHCSRPEYGVVYRKSKLHVGIGLAIYWKSILYLSTVLPTASYVVIRIGK